jgi:hypothetical protein
VDAFQLLGPLWAIAVISLTIFWMVVAWRAMKALERLAHNSDEFKEALRAWWKEKRREVRQRHEPDPSVDPE